MTSPYTADYVVTAYTGEEGRSEYGSDLVEGMGLYGFKNAEETAFIINGFYTGGGNPYYLYYDGHSGIDYRTIYQAPNGNVAVLAPAPGTTNIFNDSCGQQQLEIFH